MKRSFPWPKTYGIEISYKKLFSEFSVPTLRRSRRRISYTGKLKEARTAATYSDANHPESLRPRRTKYQKQPLDYS